MAISRKAISEIKAHRAHLRALSKVKYFSSSQD